MSILSSTFDNINVDTSCTGIAIFFGPLESEILEYLWSVYPRAVVSVAVQKYLRNIDRNITMNTINSTLTKLRNKGMVELQGDVIRGPTGNLHKASSSKIDFLYHALGEVHAVMCREFPHEWLVTIGGKL